MDAPDLLGAIAELLSAIAWPVVVVVALFRFSPEVSSLVKAVKKRVKTAENIKLAAGKVSAEVSGVITVSAEIVREQVLAVVPASTMPVLLSASEMLRLEEAKTESPRDRIAAAGSVLRSRLREIAQARGLSIHVGQDVANLALLLGNARIIGPDIQSSISQYETLVELVHSAESIEPDARAANSLVSLAEVILRALPLPSGEDAGGN